MNLDAALAKVAATRHCWIVWNDETGEVLSVTDADPGPPRLTRRPATDFGVPVRYRWFESAGVARGLLEREAEEVARVVKRGRQLAEWHRAGIEDLIGTLEMGDHIYPMRLDFDSRVLADHIW